MVTSKLWPISGSLKIAREVLNSKGARKMVTRRYVLAPFQNSIGGH